MRLVGDGGGGRGGSEGCVVRFKRCLSEANSAAIPEQSVYTIIASYAKAVSSTWVIERAVGKAKSVADAAPNGLCSSRPR